MIKEPRIAIIGLGYVGLPLTVAFAKHFPTLGFDTNPHRVKSLQKGEDHTKEVSTDDLQKALNREEGKGLSLSADAQHLTNCNIFIITVPTPVDNHNHPDLSLLEEASRMVAVHLRKGSLVIYESTVYPGVTEETCVPILEKESGMIFNKDFFVGYSPERVNPGDKVHTLDKVVKVVAGSTLDVANYLKHLYSHIIHAGIHKASSIKVAEAAKVIENTQRDINIAFVNELAQIFNRLNIDTLDVLEAAGTKWNFLPFRPGLVGGHCIGVDPYYLAQKAQETGYHPQMILSGRRINDNMGRYVAGEVIKSLVRKNNPVKDETALILGFTFKENCADIRNTRVIDIYKELSDYGMQVEVHDPWACPHETQKHYNITLSKDLKEKSYRAIILAVAHDQFLKLDILSLKASPDSVVYDVKGILKKEWVDGRP